MNDLRNSALFLVAFLILVLGLSGVEAFEENVLDFHAAFFIMLTLAALGGVLIAPKLSKYLYLLAWGGVYIVVWQFYFRYLPDPLSIQELGIQFLLVEISAGLSFTVGMHIHQLDTLIDNLSVKTYPNRTMDIDLAQDKIDAEIMRSRRYNHPLTALVLQINVKQEKDVPQSNLVIGHDLLKRFSLAKAGQIINGFSRQTDLILRDHFDRFVVLLPETYDQNLKGFIKRIQDAVLKRVGANLEWGVASFPQDALTFEELLEVAYQRLGTEVIPIFVPSEMVKLEKDD